jgi:putative transposase
MTAQLPLYRCRRFPAGIISHAVWLYSLSLGDIELIPAARGILVTRESIRLWRPQRCRRPVSSGRQIGS